MPYELNLSYLLTFLFKFYCILIFFIIKSKALFYTITS